MKWIILIVVVGIVAAGIYLYFKIKTAENNVNNLIQSL